MYDFRELKGEIIKKYGTLSNFAKNGFGCSMANLSAKLNNKTQFFSKDIDKICELLGIQIKDIGRYFFTKKV